MAILIVIGILLEITLALDILMISTGYNTHFNIMFDYATTLMHNHNVTLMSAF